MQIGTTVPNDTVYYNHLPGASVKGCQFYLRQAMWRKLQNLGLSKIYYERDSDTFGLAYLDPQEVVNVLQSCGLPHQRTTEERTTLLRPFIANSMLSSTPRIGIYTFSLTCSTSYKQKHNSCEETLFGETSTCTETGKRQNDKYPRTVPEISKKRNRKS